MKTRRGSRLVLRFAFFSLGIAFGLGLLMGDTQKIYGTLEKAFYLSAEDQVQLAPGLNLQILDVSIPSDRKPVVTFKITDDLGQGLDRAGNLTPGSVSTSFVLAYLPADSDQYVPLTTRTQTSPITGNSAIQASSDSGGRYTVLGDGLYRYTFGTTLPAGYDTSATHTLGIYSARDLAEFGLSRYIANELEDFVPQGSPVVRIRDVVRTANCNQCHDPLALHGGARQKVELCILCHNPATSDPDTGNTVDLKVMVHKIHRGANLPSVQAGTPYRIIGFNQGVNDYSHVELPQDIRNCVTCHKDSSQVNAWLLRPSRATCGSCHDHVNFASGLNHRGGIQANDNRCPVCHRPQGEFENDASIAGAHTVPYKSTQLKGVRFEIVSVANTGPGQRPVVRFKITDKAGSPISPSGMGRLAITLGGPTSDYRWYIQESATGASYADGTGTFAFSGALPADASGTYSVEIEGYVNATLNPGTADELLYRDAGDNVVKHFAVTGTVTPRRQVVDIAKCNVCHDKLQLHGNNRNQVVACVVCHNPTNTDVARRPQADLPPESIDFKFLIHRIHTGEELQFDFSVYGFGNVKHTFNEVLFPGDRRNCEKCHLPASYTVPLPATATPVTTPRNFWTPTLPTAAACLGCHDSIDAAAHAFINTAGFGESCVVCHREGAEFSVSRSHAR